MSYAVTLPCTVTEIGLGPQDLDSEELKGYQRQNLLYQKSLRQRSRQPAQEGTISTARQNSCRSQEGICRRKKRHLWIEDLGTHLAQRVLQVVGFNFSPLSWAPQGERQNQGVSPHNLPGSPNPHTQAGGTQSSKH